MLILKLLLCLIAHCLLKSGLTGVASTVLFDNSGSSVSSPSDFSTYYLCDSFSTDSSSYISANVTISLSTSSLSFDRVSAYLFEVDDKNPPYPYFCGGYVCDLSESSFSAVNTLTSVVVSLPQPLSASTRYWFCISADTPQPSPVSWLRVTDSLVSTDSEYTFVETHSSAELQLLEPNTAANPFQMHVDAIALASTTPPPVTTPVPTTPVAVPSPLAWWPLTEDSGTVMYDISGNGYHGSIGSGVTVGALDSTHSFNGTTVYSFTYSSSNTGITAPIVTGGAANITVTLWARISSVCNQQHCVLIGTETPSGTDYTWSMRVNSGNGGVQFCFQLSNCGSANLPTFDDNWHHYALVVTQDATGAVSEYAYIDGSLSGEFLHYAHGPLAALNQGTETWIGAMSYAYPWSFAGAMSDIRIFGTALTQQQIAAVAAENPPSVYQALASTTPPPVTTPVPTTPVAVPTINASSTTACIAVPNFCTSSASCCSLNCDGVGSVCLPLCTDDPGCSASMGVCASTGVASTSVCSGLYCACQ